MSELTGWSDFAWLTSVILLGVGVLLWGFQAFQFLPEDIEAASMSDSALEYWLSSQIRISIALFLALLLSLLVALLLGSPSIRYPASRAAAGDDVSSGSTDGGASTGQTPTPTPGGFA